MLLRTLLKLCKFHSNNTNENISSSNNVISICEDLVYPIIKKAEDRENYLTSYECIGLICILSKRIFL